MSYFDLAKFYKANAGSAQQMAGQAVQWAQQDAQGVQQGIAGASSRNQAEAGGAMNQWNADHGSLTDGSATVNGHQLGTMGGPARKGGQGAGGEQSWEQLASKATGADNKAHGVADALTGASTVAAQGLEGGNWSPATSGLDTALLGYGLQSGGYGALAAQMGKQDMSGQVQSAATADKKLGETTAANKATTDTATAVAAAKQLDSEDTAHLAVFKQQLQDLGFAPELVQGAMAELGEGGEPPASWNSQGQTRMPNGHLRPRDQLQQAKWVYWLRWQARHGGK